MESQKGRAKKIAQERISHLYALAQEELASHPDDSRRYVQLLRNLATKHNLRITTLKQTFCTECNTLLVPGTTATVRIHHDRRVLTCQHCNAVKRLGLI